MDSAAIAFHFVASFTVTVAALGGLLLAAGRSELSIPGAKSLRAALGAGCVLIAAGSLVHGAQLAGPEPIPATVALRSAGFALLLIFLIAAYRARLPASGRLGAAVFLSVASEAALSLPQGLHSGPPTLPWALAHSLSLLGGLGLLAWMWAVIRRSIRARLVSLLCVLVVAVVVVISGSMTQLFASNIAGESMRRAAQTAQVERAMLRSQVEESVSRARQVAELESVRAAVAARDPVLAPTVSRLQGPGGPFDTSDFMAFFDPAGAVLALSAAGRDGNVNLQPQDAVALAGTKVLRSALQGTQAGSVDRLGEAKFGLIGAFPVYNPPGFDPPGSPGRLAGAVALGRVIDTRYLRGVAGTADERSYLISRNQVLLGSAPPAREVIPQSTQRQEAVFDRGEVVTVRGRIAGVEYFSSYIPLQQADGEVIGALVVSRRSTVLEETRRDVTRTVFLLALIATAVASALSYLSAAKITRPILELTGAAEKVRAGDLEARVNGKGSDEVGVLAETFDQMTAGLGRLTGELRAAAETEAGLRSRLETILQSMADGVVAVDADGTVVAFNREAERIFGLTQEQALGRRVERVLRVHDQDGAEVALPIYSLRSGSVRGTAARSAGETGRAENGGERPSGAGGGAEANGHHGIPVAVISAPIHNDSGVVSGGVAVVRDLSSEFQIERMKTAFLSNVSHELRTPLTPIKGYSDLLRRKEVPREKAITFLDGIMRSAERLERIIEMLVDFSAMEAGRLTPRRSPIDLDKVTADLAGKWTQDAPGHTFERKGFRSLPVVELDAKLVPLAIVELVDNAVKFSPKGGKVTLSAALTPGQGGNQELRISVKDRGIGIGKEQLSVISSSFSQVDESATRAYGGLGLGLAYIRRIVEGHKGRLEIESTPGRGSCFTMVFPVQTAQREPRTTAGAGPRPRGKTTAKSRRPGRAGGLNESPAGKNDEAQAAGAADGDVEGL